jgi:hypothetical protein
MGQSGRSREAQRIRALQDLLIGVYDEWGRVFDPFMTCQLDDMGMMEMRDSEETKMLQGEIKRLTDKEKGRVRKDRDVPYSNHHLRMVNWTPFGTFNTLFVTEPKETEEEYIERIMQQVTLLLLYVNPASFTSIDKVDPFYCDWDSYYSIRDELQATLSETYARRGFKFDLLMLEDVRALLRRDGGHKFGYNLVPPCNKITLLKHLIGIKRFDRYIFVEVQPLTEAATWRFGYKAKPIAELVWLSATLQDESTYWDPNEKRDRGSEWQLHNEQKKAVAAVCTAVLRAEKKLIGPDDLDEWFEQMGRMDYKQPAMRKVTFAAEI